MLPEEHAGSGWLYEGGGFDHDTALRRWPPLPQPQVPQDLLAHGRLLDDGDEAHGPAAPGAATDVAGERALHEVGPREPASAVRVVGPSEIFGGGSSLIRLLRLLMYSCRSCPSARAGCSST